MPKYFLKDLNYTNTFIKSYTPYYTIEELKGIFRNYNLSYTNNFLTCIMNWIYPY